jgi:hypothetical protein
MSGKTAKDESEQQKRVVELPLELHNELILFATRKTLACLVEFNNNINCNHIGKGIAILAAKRLQSIRVGSVVVTVSLQYLKFLCPYIVFY